MPLSMDFHDRYFESIQALRGIAALLVILEHISLFRCGAFGVDIFFCISGFMIMFTTHKNTACFFRKRLIRILPLYELCTLGTYGLLLLFPSMFQQSVAQPLQLFKSMLFIPFDIGNGVLQPIFRIGWTVNCEIFFYLLFGISCRLSRKWRGLLCSCFLGGLVAAARFLPVNFAPLTFYGDPVMLDFILGILCYDVAWFLYRCLQKKTHRENPRKWLLTAAGLFSLLVSLGLLLFLAFTEYKTNILGFYRPFHWGLPCALTVLGFLIAGLFLKIPRPFVRLGDISFSVYLVHYYPVMLMNRRLPTSLDPEAILLILLTILLVLALSYGVWYFVENKLTLWLRQRLLPT